MPSFIAILGAGAIGGALAHRLAARDRARDIRLIDTEARVAQGKALDILQSAPIDSFSGRISSGERIEDAAGASVIVLADAAAGDREHSGEEGLSMLRRLTAMERAAPFVFAGAAQRVLMGRAASELHIERRRLVGSAPAALESAVKALAALELDSSGTEIQLRVVGVPPNGALVAWEGATAFGAPISASIPPHRLAAISAQLPRLWPPGPLVLASAAARAAEAVLFGSRRRLSCFVVLDDPPSRGAVVALPAQLGPRGLERVVTPALSRQEQTQLDNALSVS